MMIQRDSDEICLFVLFMESVTFLRVKRIGVLSKKNY